MKHFEIKQGLLHRDGKPVFAIGTSYYPSYHARKVSVPEGPDRLPEMEKDIRRMADAGIHLVRCAALGDVAYDEKGNVTTSTPFIDALIRRAEECGLGVMVRLQGYSMNLSGHPDTYMIGSQGEEMDKTKWWDFIQNSFFHAGILEDNDRGTEALARHFAPMPALAGFQTYNEPHYPTDEIFDYHPDTIAAYRVWLAEKGYMTADEARAVEPPHTRPEGKREDVTPWILWRLFSMQALSDFLNHCSDIAKETTGYETMTCLTTDPTNSANAVRGVNFFDSAERMDAIGITQYYRISKPEAYLANMNLDLAESAGATYGKPMWLVEYDARTDIPPAIFRRLNYMALGAGCKGIMHYQWRGDHIFPDSPEGNGFGFLNCDGTPTENYENACAVIKTINLLSDHLISADRVRSGVGILHSDYAFIHADGRENAGIGARFFNLKNSHLASTLRIYTELRKCGIAPDFTRARDLAENPLSISLLFIPARQYLSDEEERQIAAFIEKGGRVAYFDSPHRYENAYLPHDYVERKYKSDYDAEDILLLAGIEPEIKMAAPSHYLHEVLTGNGFRIVVITCISNAERPPEAITLTCRSMRDAELYTFGCDAPLSLPIENGAVTTPPIEDGAILILKTE